MNFFFTLTKSKNLFNDYLIRKIQLVLFVFLFFVYFFYFLYYVVCNFSGSFMKQSKNLNNQNYDYIHIEYFLDRVTFSRINQTIAFKDAAFFFFFFVSRHIFNDSSPFFLHLAFFFLLFIQFYDRISRMREKWIQFSIRIKIKHRNFGF